MEQTLDFKSQNVKEMRKEELNHVNGGILPKKWRGDDYNVVLRVILGSGLGGLYDIGYLLGRI